MGDDPISELQALSRTFGPEAARRKERLLSQVARLERLSAGRLRLLHDTLYFIRAYPDDPRVLALVAGGIAALRGRVERLTTGRPRHGALLNSGLPGASNSYAYSYGVLLELVRLFPGCLELDWEEIEDISPLFEALGLTLTAAEAQGLEDEELSESQWFEQARRTPGQTDLELTLELFSASSLTPKQQVHVFESLDLPCLYRLWQRGSGRCEVSMDPAGVCFQRGDIPRERFPLAPEILRPLPARQRRRLTPAAGRRMLDLSLAALCSRNLEIYPLIYGDPRAVTVVDCGRGLEVLLAGVQPGFRSPLEALFFFLIIKNGVPIAYGPASSFCGCCELGINLFPEFRGGEIRYIYAQFMRALYHLAHVRYFFLMPYGMGVGNEEALRSGAFWFYRKLGFVPTNPRVEALAQKEEQRMALEPGHRCSLRTLRRLSDTRAVFDLSRGACQPLAFGRLGLELSRVIAERFDGDRRRARRSSLRRLLRDLGVRDFGRWRPEEQQAARAMAPILALIPDLGSWPARDRRDLARLVRAKGATSGEFDFAGRTLRHRRLGPALQALVPGQ